MRAIQLLVTPAGGKDVTGRPIVIYTLITTDGVNDSIWSLEIVDGEKVWVPLPKLPQT